MKKIIVIALAGLLISCSGNGFKITGEIKGMPDGTKVFLEKQDKLSQTGLSPIDTVKLENGKFTFEGKAIEPEIHVVLFESKPGENPQGFALVLEKGNIKAQINKDSISYAKLSGTYNNDEFTKYNSAMWKIKKKADDFQMKNGALYEEASKKQDTVTINKLMKDLKKLREETDLYNSNYAETNPKSFLSVLITEGMTVAQEPKFDKIKKIFDALDQDLKITKPGKKIKEALDAFSKTKTGEKAPDFSAKNPEGKVISLKESLGKVTIIDFWASWCNPCRLENPNVVALYNEFHGKGLNIIGVSLDREGDAAKWKEAIAKDKLTWTQVSNLKFWEEPIALKYNVKSIPATFVLDAKGNIVAKDLHGAELKAKVAELLAK
jgi:peroxiredoxin